jgi:hypothetical protein
VISSPSCPLGLPVSYSLIAVVAHLQHGSAIPPRPPEGVCQLLVDTALECEHLPWQQIKDPPVKVGLEEFLITAGKAVVGACGVQYRSRYSYLNWRKPDCCELSHVRCQDPWSVLLSQLHVAVSGTAAQIVDRSALLTFDISLGVLWAFGALVPKAEDIELPLEREHPVQARPPP